MENTLINWEKYGRGWKNPYTGDIVYSGATPPSELPQPPANNNLIQQILASSDPTKWTGEGFGSAQANAADMAKVLGAAGITDINQLGVRTVPGGQTQDYDGNVYQLPDTQQYYNKATGQAVNAGYDRAGGNIFSGTFAGSGSTGYGVQFNDQGNPQFYTQYGGSTSDIGSVAPLIGIAGMAFGIPPIIGEALGFTGAAASAAGGAVLGGSTAALTGGNVLKGALTGGALGYAGSQFGGPSGEYSFNGPEVTNPTMSDLTGAGQLTGLDQYASGATLSDLMGGGAGGNVSGGGTVGYDPVTNTQGYYDELTGKFVQDPSGGMQSPLTNETSGTNLSSMDAYNYNPNTQTWTTPDGQAYTSSTSSGLQAGGTGADLMKSAGIGAAGTAGAAGAASTGGNLLSGMTTGNALLDSALISGASGVAGNLVTGNAIKNSIANQTAAAQQAGSTLKDIYNQQLGFVQPYQQLGQQGASAITAQMPYLQHQFNAQDLAAGLAPNYDFMLQQGQMANQRAANVGGGALGGNALTGLQRYTQDYAGNAYQNAFNNYQNQRSNIFNTLSNIANLGQTANQQAIGAGTGYGQQQTNLTTGLAAAQAGANVGQAQNTSNLLSNIGNNLTLASLLGQKQAVA